MAVALRPAVLLMLLASALFLASGWLDGARPGADAATYAALGWASYAFGLLNLLVAVLIARGSERILALRIGLAAFFVLERPVTAFAFGTRPVESIAVHVLTALVELVILLTTLRVWRLGHSVSQDDLALLTSPIGEAPYPVAAPHETTSPAEPQRARSPMAQRVAPRIPPATARAIALLVFLLAGTLVADGLVAGVLPDVSAAPDVRALVYVYAALVLLVGLAAVSGRRLPLRLLYALAVLLFLERVFTVAAVGTGASLASLALHGAAAVAAVVLALACAAALRSTRRRVAIAQPA